MSAKGGDKSKTQYFKSGVLPFRLSGGGEANIEYLLGKESEAKDYQFSNTWSAFEGGSKPNESPETTAAREYLEESCGCFNPYTNLEGLVLALHRRKYTLRVTIRSRPDSFHKSDNLFALQVPSSSPCDEHFSMYQERLRRLVALEAGLQQEKNKLQSNHHFLFKGSPVQAGDKRLTVTDIDSAMRTLEKGVDTLTVCFRYSSGQGSEAHVGSATLKVNLVNYTSADIENVKRYLDWYTKKRLFEASAEAFLSEHPSTVAVERTSGQLPGSAGTIKVNPDCLEKCEVKWWTATEIESAVEQNTAKFRPSFMKMFKIADKALRAAVQSPSSHNNN